MMRYAYPFTLTRRAVVATMDLSAANLDLLSSDHWLSDLRNILLLQLVAPARQERGAPARGPRSPAGQIQVGLPCLNQTGEAYCLYLVGAAFERECQKCPPGQIQAGLSPV